MSKVTRVRIEMCEDGKGYVTISKCKKDRFLTYQNARLTYYLLTNAQTIRFISLYAQIATTPEYQSELIGEDGGITFKFRRIN